MRGVRISRIEALLDATTNAASTMNNEFRGWPKGEPVGILIGEEDITILSTYQALGVPRVGSLPEGLEIVSLT